MIDSKSPPIRTTPLARLAAARRLERATSMPFAAERRPAARSAGPRSTGPPKTIILRGAGRRRRRAGPRGDHRRRAPDAGAALGDADGALRRAGQREGREPAAHGLVQ